MAAATRFQPDAACAAPAITPTVEELFLGSVSFADLLEHFSTEPDFVLLDTRTPERDAEAYSFFAFAPFARLVSKGRALSVRTGRHEHTTDGDPFAALQDLLDRYRVAPPASPPLPFHGGGVGYLGYELGRQIEVLPETAVDELQLPDCYFCFYNCAITLSHRDGRIFLSHFDPPGDAGGVTRARIREELRRVTLGAGRKPKPARLSQNEGPEPVVVPDLSEAAYVEAVRRIKDYIYAGDVYQVNMTQRFGVDLGGLSSWALYKHLLDINPAPFAAYLRFEGHEIVSSSPERFLLVRERHVETRPIKGTIKRGVTPDEDAKQRALLVHSTKNQAELAMIVDLLRNDLGRVCTPGSVRVRGFVELETFPSVHHLVATIVGELAADRTVIDLLKATFPGGSITGAPKIRAMEIIDELEPVTRGVYTGSIGYLGFHGVHDLNIAIRTIVVKDGTAYIHAGGGVVADSDEQDEYQESLLKASKLFQAVRGAWVAAATPRPRAARHAGTAGTGERR